MAWMHWVIGSVSRVSAARPGTPHGVARYDGLMANHAAPAAPAAPVPSRQPEPAAARPASPYFGDGQPSAAPRQYIPAAAAATPAGYGSTQTLNGTRGAGRPVNDDDDDVDVPPFMKR